MKHRWHYGRLTALGTLVVSLTGEAELREPIVIEARDVETVTFRNDVLAVQGSAGAIVPSCRASEDGEAMIHRFSILAGSTGGSGNRDGVGSVARFASPTGGTVDAEGNAYVADSNGHTIRKVTPNGKVTTLAGVPERPGYRDGPGSSALFFNPRGLAIDAAGYILVADAGNHVIRRVSPTGDVTTFAGLGETSGSSDGDLSVARFRLPSGVAVDGAGAVYVADTGNVAVRKIASDGKVRTIGGILHRQGSLDGPFMTAQFCSPTAVQINGAGEVFVADGCSHAVRRIDTNLKVTTVAGTLGKPGNNDGYVTESQLNNPSGLAVDAGGNLFIADSGNSVIRMLSTNRVMSTFAGSAGQAGINDGARHVARLNAPSGLALDRDRNLYIADEGNHTLRRSSPSGDVATIAGTALDSRSADGNGSGARFASLFDMTLDRAGNAYLFETSTGYASNPVIRKVDTRGGVTTLVLTRGSKAADFPTEFVSRSLAVDDSGQGFFTAAHAVFRFTADGLVFPYAGLHTQSGYNDGKGQFARFYYPDGLVLDAGGNLYVADKFNHTIRMIAPDGTVTTIAGRAGVPGRIDGQGKDARLTSPLALTFGPGGIFILEDGRSIRKLSPTADVTSLFHASYGSADGFEYKGEISLFDSLAVDSSGSIYVADYYNRLIRRVSPQGEVTTIGGDLMQQGVSEGSGLETRFVEPLAVAVDRTDRLLVLDRNRLYRAVECPATALCLAGGRFTARLRAKDPRTGAEAVGEPHYESDASGFFSLPGLTGDSENPEVFFKLLDGRAFNGHFWVFHGGLTDFEYSLVVTDEETSEIKTYAKPGYDLCGGADTDAFSDGAGHGLAGIAVEPGAIEIEPERVQPEITGACDPGSEICVLGGRFAISLTAKDPRSGRTGSGFPIPRTDQVGYFSVPALTNDRTNPEIFVKMLDGRGVNGRYWFFYGGLTDFEITLSVRNTLTDIRRTYSKPSGSFCGGVDTSIF